MKRIGAIIFTAVGALVLALPASAQQYPPSPGISPTGVQTVPGVAPRVAERGAGGLAVTGADLVLWVGLGVALLALGIVLLRLGRRARA